MKTRGFTLIEMAVVISILAMAAAGGLAIVTRITDADAMRTTRERMEKILRMTDLYVLRYGHVPCPTSFSMLPTDATFSLPGITPGSCQTVNGGYVAANHVSMGAVPTGALGLHPDYMLDGWGRKFSFVVDEDMSTSAGFSSVSSDIAILDAAGISVVKDGAGADAKPAVLVISQGRNGFGAWPYKATTASQKVNDSRCSAVPCATRTMEDDNAHRDNNPGPAFDENFRLLPLREQAGSPVGNASTAERSNQIFDDILMWRTKWDLEQATNR